MAQKNSTSRKRIAEMMEILRITQADIVKRTGIPKSTLSNYLSGKRTPDQEHLSVLSDPYGINPAWLMGYDTVMYFADIPRPFNSGSEFEAEWEKLGGGKHPINLSDHERMVILSYRAADELDRLAVQRILKIETKKDATLDA